MQSAIFWNSFIRKPWGVQAAADTWANLLGLRLFGKSWKTTFDKSHPVVPVRELTKNKKKRKLWAGKTFARAHLSFMRSMYAKWCWVRNSGILYTVSAHDAQHWQVTFDNGQGKRRESKDMPKAWVSEVGSRCPNLAPGKAQEVNCNSRVGQQLQWTTAWDTEAPER